MAASKRAQALNSAPLTSEALSDRRIEVDAQLLDLKQQRGIAYLDGKEFDDAQIQKLEAELEALNAAEAEATNRQRAAEAEELQRRRMEVKKQIIAMEGDRIAAVARAEAAATELMVSLMDIQTYSDKMGLAFRSLGYRCDKVIPEGVQERFSRRLTAVLKPLLVRSWRQYGSINFPSPLDVFATEWVSDEKELMAREMDSAFKQLSQ